MTVGTGVGVGVGVADDAEVGRSGACRTSSVEGAADAHEEQRDTARAFAERRGDPAVEELGQGIAQSVDVTGQITL